MLKIWPSPSASDQITPRPLTNGGTRVEKNPFEQQLSASTTGTITNGAITPTVTGTTTPSSPSANTHLASTSPARHRHHLLSTHQPQLGSPSIALPPQLTTLVSMQTPPLASGLQTPATSGGPRTPPTSPKGQLHVKILQARGLKVPSSSSRPYVVIQFEQNEFVSRDPTHESEKEAKGVPAPLSRTNSSTALGALGAIGIKQAFEAAARQRATSNAAKPGSNASSGSSNGAATPGPGLFNRLSAHNPVWKHQVSFDVTSEDSVLTFNIYDRLPQKDGTEAFLGSLSVKPVLVHDRTVDHWHALKPRGRETITGEIRVQITYEQYKTKRSLTPRDFEFLKLIGKGTFGRVFQVRKKDSKRIYAMKVLSKKEIVAKKEVAHTIGERKILQTSMSSPFLVGLKFSFQSETELYLVTDFKSGGELFWHLQKETRFTQDRARFYIAELVLALEHLHKYDIVYRDLKPENILLDATGHIALCDFGLSKPDLPNDALTNTFCGTTEYLAPEVLLDDHGYTKLVDFWSLGVLLFEMCCGWSPFYAEDTQQMYKNICFGKIRFPRGIIDEDGKQFVKGLLNRNPKHRLGAERDAAELKEHEFFKDMNWAALARKEVEPPFKPIVDSDDSTANFDPEFTQSDIRESGIDAFDDLDEDDPSEDWAASIGTVDGPTRSFNGPAMSLTSGLTMSTATTPPATTVAPPPTSEGITIKKPKSKRGTAQGTPLTSSVQEKFIGFTFSGEGMSYTMAPEIIQRERDREAAAAAAAISQRQKDGTTVIVS